MGNSLQKAVILGTVQMGSIYGIKNKAGNPSLMSEDTALAILDHSYRNGITYFDTARDYGAAESILGRWARRSQAKILTKIKNSGSLAEAEDTFALSLEALGLKSVHCLSLHLFEDCLNDSNLELLSSLKSAGLIERTGVSVYNIDEIDHIIRHTDLQIIQSPFSVIDHSGMRGETFKKAKEAGRTIHVRSVFLQGLLLMNRGSIPTHLLGLLPQLRKLDHHAAELGCSVRDLCLGYVMNSPDVDGVIFGVDSLSDLEENLTSIAKSSTILMNRSLLESSKPEDLRLLNPSLWSRL
jgi:aryl-alcohol dehydrogenase-like predicted oxidoreductase